MFKIRRKIHILEKHTKILRTKNSLYSSLLINYSSFNRNTSHSQHNLILSSHSNPILKLNIQSMFIYL